MPESAYERARRHSTPDSSHHQQMQDLIGHLDHVFQNDANNGSHWDHMQAVREHLNAARSFTNDSIKYHNQGRGDEAASILDYASSSVRNATHRLRRLGVNVLGTPALDASDIADDYRASIK